MKKIDESNILIFGASSPVGLFFYKELISKKIINSSYVKRFSRYQTVNFNTLDLTSPGDAFFNQKFKKVIIISFAPIWKLSKFLDYCQKKDISFMNSIKFIIACSSTSIISKRFSFSNYDKSLFKKLMNAENALMRASKKNKFTSIILRPTMVYGGFNTSKDSNIEVIKKILKKLPFILLPNNSGLRQPIHAFQLSRIVLNLFEKNLKNKDQIIKNKILNVGGDECLSYTKMIQRVSEKIHAGKSLKKNNIILIPNRLFCMIIFPTLFFSPKVYESLLRIMVDLSGFKKSYKVSDLKPEKFLFQE